MNRQYRRKMEKLQKKEYDLFLKKNKSFLDSIKGEEGTQKTLEKIIIFQIHFLICHFLVQI